MISKRLLALFLAVLVLFAVPGCKSNEKLKNLATINYHAFVQKTDFYEFIEDFRITEIQPLGKDDNGKMVYDVRVSVTFSRNFDLSDSASIAEALKYQSPVYDWVDEYFRYFHFTIQKREGVKAYFFDFTE